MEKQYRHRNAKIVHPDNPKDPLIIVAVSGSDFALDLKDPQIRRYLKNGKLEFTIKPVPDTTVRAG